MRPGLLLVAALFAAAATGCKREGCVGGDDGRCLPPAACGALAVPVCAGAASLRVGMVEDASARAPGPKAVAAKGDLVLENDRVRAVLDLPAHAQGIAPTGGTIIDLSPIGADGKPVGDQINAIFQGAGLLPRDAVAYDAWEVLDQSVAQTPAGAYVAVVFRGHLEGDPRVTVVTRYELRPCEAGLRVRTDLYNGARDPNTLALTDAFFWGDRTLLPFVPLPGHGFRMPELDLLKLDQAWREWPFLAARTQAAPDVSYAVVPCDRPRSAGFNSTTLSASGVPLVTTLPGDGFSHERFILAVPGAGVAPAVDEALRVRAAVHREPAAVTVSGRVVTIAGAPLNARGGRAASLLFYEPASGAGVDPDDETRRLPRTEVVPGPDGRYHVDLPPNRVYRVQPYAFGRPASPPRSLSVGTASVDAGDLALERAAHLTATVEASPGVPAAFAELVLIPVDAPAPGAVSPSLYGSFEGCDPMLGPAHGGSPACNRALTADGRFDLLVPPGRYYVYATRGPFASLDRREVALAAGDEATISLLSAPLPDLVPAGTLSGDFHVHGAASYDTSIPDQDRVVSFLAAGVDVVVATDHDVVSTYADTVQALGAGDRLVVIPGVEATPNILWFSVPGESFPKTLGHFNFWPLKHDPLAPRNGAAWDERLEPGQLMDAYEPLFDGLGVRQMNHPWSEAKLGRDEGLLRVLKADPRTPFATEGDPSFAAKVLLRTPGAAGGRRNLDWDVQEVMTGASRRDWLRYRALWFSLLSQGVLRAGTANSDTHSLGLERIGYPRNLVFGGHDRATFDRERFDADVRKGHLIGTNGPVLDVTIDDAAGELHRPGLDPFVPAARATLTVAIASAPWIPVSEIRVYVDGALRKTVDVSKTFMDRNHFGLAAARDRIAIPLDDSVLRGTGDSWIVVEAGLHQDVPPDEHGEDEDDGEPDGLPDLPDAEVPRRPPNAAEPSMDRFDLEAVAPGVWPVAFTNPFLLNRDGGGWKAPGLRP
jgi:hypothetical protein